MTTTGPGGAANASAQKSMFVVGGGGPAHRSAAEAFIMLKTWRRFRHSMNSLVRSRVAMASSCGTYVQQQKEEEEDARMRRTTTNLRLYKYF